MEVKEKMQDKQQEKSPTQSTKKPNIQDINMTQPKGTNETISSNPMKCAHFMLQGKGGVGKSFVAALIAQYLRSKGLPAVVVDTDPVNATLMGYKSFDTQRIELMENGVIVERNFDSLMERIMEEDTNFVIDNGAASFVPLSNYLLENDAINMLSDSGKQVVIHTVVTGGQAIMDTLSGFADLVEQMPAQARVVVWLNEFFGDIAAQGKTFEEMNVYLTNKHRVHGVVRIARQTSSTYGKDVQLMLDSKLTFDEVNLAPEFRLMSKSRLFRVKQDIYHQLEEVI